MSIETSSLKFSGHQTFPIRYGWIYKIIQEVMKGESLSSKENVEKQMRTMGMGKNMVLSVRHWIRTLNLVTCIDKKEQSYKLTPLANLLFVGKASDVKPYDEFMDKVGTVWLLHWLMQSVDSQNAELNAARWFFNYYNGVRTNKEHILSEIRLSLKQHEKELTEATLKKDIDCLLQMYAVKKTSVHKINEDSFTSPFTELGLISQESAKDYRAELSKQASLPIEVFSYAVIDFMQRKQKDTDGNVIHKQRTVSFDSLLNDVGSPGRVFRLSSTGLSEKLDQLEVLTIGQLAWTDTQGLRQLQHAYSDLQLELPEQYLVSYYQEGKQRDVK
ncbi:DUF4007 family protein [Vibrio splendidus]|uniref:DUF4007 family protein n=1 Tax=Vibrio splendidus TaxID=29497 RepID=UPI000C864E26|nr:DUF4007 family protein [Vibrio splendidus]